LAATVPVSQVMEPVVLVSVEVSLVVPPVLEAPPAPVLLVVEPVVSELLLAVFPPKPVVPVVVTVAVVVPPVVDALDVVELTAPKPVVVAVLVEDTVLVVAVVLLLVLSMVAVEPVDSFSGSVPSLPSLLQAATRAQSARAAPPRSRRVAFEGRCGRYAVTVWPRSRLASTWGISMISCPQVIILRTVSGSPPICPPPPACKILPPRRRRPRRLSS